MLTLLRQSLYTLNLLTLFFFRRDLNTNSLNYLHFLLKQKKFAVGRFLIKLMNKRGKPDRLLNLANAMLHYRQADFVKAFDFNTMDFFQKEHLYNRIINSRTSGDKYPDFRNYLKGKKVAVVGPCRTVSDDASKHEEEINSYDIVCRIGYSGAESLPQHTGKRCDISFYAHHKIKGIINSENKNSIFSLRYAILKEKLSLKYFKEDNKQNNIFFIISCNSYNCFENLIANAGVDMIVDVLSFGAKEVKIFNVDLFLSNVYPKGYISNKIKPTGQTDYENPREEMLRSFMHHDPFCHFELYRFLKEKFPVSFDSYLNSIIEKGVYAYAEALEKNFKPEINSGK